MPNKQNTRLKSQIYNSNITKRGNVKTSSKSDEKEKIGPILLGVFLFVVVGSVLFQMLSVATKSGGDF